jgi:outer membrane biogenesis lipoprotein LolB
MRAAPLPLAAGALLLLAGCAARTPAPTAAPQTAAEAECRQEARNSPAVRDLARRMVIGIQAQMDRVQEEQRIAESQAYTDCLRRRGLSRGGGVEPVRRPGLF